MARVGGDLTASRLAREGRKKNGAGERRGVKSKTSDCAQITIKGSFAAGNLDVYVERRQNRVRFH